MKHISTIGNNLSEPTWEYLPDIAAFCQLIYSSPHRPVTEPRAKDLNTDDELYDSIREKWLPVDDEDFPGLPHPPVDKKPIGGLVLDLWKTKDTESGTWILFFRGSDRVKNGWWTNIRWITRFIPFTWDQYAQVIAYTSQITDSILKQDPHATIIAAGHSLGGGLAQTAGYCSPHIEKVYAFNSSPVTGYFSIDKSVRERSQKGLGIFRIYERGEGLAYIREFMAILWPISNQDPKITTVKCNFMKGGLISQHSMSELAKNIKRKRKREEGKL